MATRSKPYTLGLAIMDLILLALSCGMWMLVMLVREMYRFFGPR